MCIAKEKLVAKKTTAKSVNVMRNWTNIFTKPLKPKLPRKIVRSAKLNLNRYWAKFEELMSGDEEEPLNNQMDRSYRPLIEPEFIPNNQPPVLNVQNISPEELSNFMSKQFFIEKNVNRSGRYKFYNDDSLYHGVNLNPPQIQPPAPLYETACCTCCQAVNDPIYENIYFVPNVNWRFQ